MCFDMQKPSKTVTGGYRDSDQSKNLLGTTTQEPKDWFAETGLATVRQNGTNWPRI